MKNIVEILKAARARITDPEHWTTGTYARSVTGRHIEPNHPKAVCWCDEGAVKAEASTVDLAEAAIHELDETLSLYEDGGKRGGFVPAYNDHHTHAENIELFDRTIARLEGGAR